ncbi:hypothetical protein HanRHA438_Chr04g0170961 [Helianthus annuus]|nr:hypothetical protein HanRHA438_Chr04g0170961 [Helianthus annuus]
MFWGRGFKLLVLVCFNIVLNDAFVVVYKQVYVPRNKGKIIWLNSLNLVKFG